MTFINFRFYKGELKNLGMTAVYEKNITSNISEIAHISNEILNSMP